MTTAAYKYGLHESGGLEIISYQWHPNVQDSVSYPHLHISHGAGLGREEFQRSHLPTGRVTLEAFVRCLIDDFGVPKMREDWEDVLDQNLAEFEQDRSW